MNKVLKNYNHKESSHEKLAMQSRTICKRSKENFDEKIEKKRLHANKRERERTQLRNVVFEQLRSKFKKDATKQEVLLLSRQYIKFLHKVSSFYQVICQYC